MPLVDIHLIEGVFDKDQKQEMIRKVTDAMVDIEGEAMRGVTWVRFCNGPQLVNPFLRRFLCRGHASVRGQRRAAA